MKTRSNKIERGKISQRGRGLGTVTRGMVRKRARELAEAAGRPRRKILDSDLQEARRELTGRESIPPAPTVAEQLPEDKRWDPTPGSVSRQAPAISPPDDQTVAERLVEEGVAEAEHDQIAKAAREELKRARKERKEQE